MKHTIRTVVGVLLIIMGVIAGPIPILQGWMFFVAAVAVLGTDHAIVQWARRRLERYPWAARMMDKLGIHKKEEGAPPT